MAAQYVLKKTVLLQDVAHDCPRAAELLTEYGLHCLTCYLREYDTLEMGAKVHGMTDEELDNMIDEINKQLEKELKDQNKQLKNQKAKVKITTQK